MAESSNTKVDAAKFESRRKTHVNTELSGKGQGSFNDNSQKLHLCHVNRYFNGPSVDTAEMFKMNDVESSELTKAYAQNTSKLIGWNLDVKQVT